MGTCCFPPCFTWAVKSRGGPDINLALPSQMAQCLYTSATRLSGTWGNCRVAIFPWHRICQRTYTNNSDLPPVFLQLISITSRREPLRVLFAKRVCACVCVCVCVCFCGATQYVRVNLRWCLIMLWLILHGSSHSTINVFLLACIGISVAHLSGGSACYAGPVCVCVCVRVCVCVCVLRGHTQQIRTHSQDLCEWQWGDSGGIKENDGPPHFFLISRARRGAWIR